MKLPPMLCRLQFRRGFALWLPLFLIWPIAFALLVVFSPFFLIGLMILKFGAHVTWDMPAILEELYRALCALRGLEVDFEDPHLKVRIRLQ